MKSNNNLPKIKQGDSKASFFEQEFKFKADQPLPFKLRSGEKKPLDTQNSVLNIQDKFKIEID